MTYHYPVFSGLGDVTVVEIVPFSSGFVFAVGGICKREREEGREGNEKRGREGDG